MPKLSAPKQLAWSVENTVTSEDYKIFTAKRVQARHPETSKSSQFTLLEAPDWVNVLALSSDGHCVLVKQYRHGTQQITLELPGGMVDPGEAPLVAAKRELVEETGYASERWFQLGYSHPNPAFLNNKCYFYLALECQLHHAQRLDSNEVISLHFESIADIPQLITDGAIDHSLVLSCLLRFHMANKNWECPNPAQLPKQLIALQC